MHDEARAYVETHRTDETLAVLEIGGRWTNGGVRDLFPNAEPYVCVDIVDGEGVDVVADAATWEPDRTYDLVVCTEVFEHTPDWREILATMATACRPGGRLVLTMAGPGRSPHGAWGGGPDPAEFYMNVAPNDLALALKVTGWEEIDVDYIDIPGDTRATAIRGER